MSCFGHLWFNVERSGHIKIPRGLSLGGGVGFGDRDLGVICSKEFFEVVGKVGMSRKLEQGGKAKGTAMRMVYFGN